MQNLDLKCAELAEKLADGANKDREKLLTDGLGVLQEQGLYAFFLFLKASKRARSHEVSGACEKFLRDQGLLQDHNNDLFQGLKSLADRLDDLLFARDLLTQALVYARYHAKARTEGASRE
ncbi:MAG: hypothetical protein KatS3mg011_1031 [Acidimicrobiia bacterium]|nr:MAG: hypothetical protein KatS3mg011_1031 [Acidimicrobiia bacterium]